MRSKKRGGPVRPKHLLLCVFLIASAVSAQAGKNKGNGGGLGTTENRPLEVLVYDLYPDNVTPYSIRSDGFGSYLDQLDGTDAVIQGTSGNFIFRAAGTRDFDQAVRSLVFALNVSDLSDPARQVALDAGLDDPSSYEPGAVVGVGQGVADMRLGEVRACKTNVRLATIDGYRYGLQYLGDGEPSDMTALYWCTAEDPQSACTQWVVTGNKALLGRHKLKGKDSRIRETLGVVTMPFEIVATVTP